MTLRGGLAGSPLSLFRVTRMLIVASSTRERAPAEPSRWSARISLRCAPGASCSLGVGFGSFITPESAEVRLARIRGGVDYTISVRTLPPNVKALRCMMMWVGGPGGEPELWCPAAPPLPEDQAPPAVPTS